MNIKLRSLKLSLVLSVALFFSCKKSDNRQYSKWYVNTDSFSINNVTVVKGKMVTDMTSEISDNYFAFSFNMGELPTNGSLPINCSTPNFGNVCFSIAYRGVGYTATPASISYINASAVNGKAQYTLAPTWFIKDKSPNDSVLVHGIFNEP